VATIASGDPVAAAGEITERSGWADAPTAQVASRAALVTPRDYILNAEFGARSLISGW
jgi:2-keto-3-deoxy-galactonokinase